MFRLEDIEEINKNIDKIKRNAENEYKIHNEPTYNEIKKTYEFIKNFIIKRKKIIYGGFAQNILLKEINIDYGFYEEVDGVFYNWPDVADMEFYSYEPVKDAMELSNELFAAGFKHITCSEGVHEGTYKIYVNFINYCDIAYMPKNIYDELPTIITKNNFICAHPHFMLIDTYRILNDPLTSYWRIDKSIKRFQTIIKYYPITNETLLNKKIDLVVKDNVKDILHIILKNIIHKSKFIVVGLYAFNYYINKIDDKLIKIPYYEIISNDLSNDHFKIEKILKLKIGNALVFKKYNKFYEYFDNRIEYYYNDTLILIMYGNNERCIVYNYSEKKKIYFGTSNLVYLYLLINYFLYLLNKNKNMYELFFSLLLKLHHAKIKYLTKNKITVVDKSPFQDFTYKCFGVPVNPIRESRLNTKSKKFRYSPSGKQVKIPIYNFTNMSGNLIQKKKK